MPLSLLLPLPVQVPQVRNFLAVLAISQSFYCRARICSNLLKTALDGAESNGDDVGAELNRDDVDGDDLYTGQVFADVKQCCDAVARYAKPRFEKTRRMVELKRNRIRFLCHRGGQAAGGKPTSSGLQEGADGL